MVRQCGCPGPPLYGTHLCPALTSFPLSLQIEFVTGTKKGTTTNATATTTTTASTAVAGRRGLVRFQPHHEWSEGHPALSGGGEAVGILGLGSHLLCFFLTPEFVKACREPGVGSPVHWLPWHFCGRGRSTLTC